MALFGTCWETVVSQTVHLPATSLLQHIIVLVDSVEIGCSVDLMGQGRARTDTVW